MYLHSNKIHVFPFGSTRKVDPIARIFNEQNLSRLVRNLTDVTGFVISYDESTNVMEFMLYGYYFKADLTDVIVSGEPLYVSINVQKEFNSSYDYDEFYEYLLGGDTDGTGETVATSEFTAVTFGNDASEGNYSLYILDKDGKVPTESKSKFSLDSIGSGNSTIKYDWINCGTSTHIVD